MENGRIDVEKQYIFDTGKKHIHLKSGKKLHIVMIIHKETASTGFKGNKLQSSSHTSQFAFGYCKVLLALKPSL